MSNPTPLEKQLLHLDLSKGINEKDRPETADPATCLTRVENLVQDQAGAWTKRAGLYQLGAALTTGTPAKMLRLRGGLGTIASTGHFYQLEETVETQVPRGRVSPFSLEADSVSGSGRYGANAHSFSACTNFYAIAGGDDGDWIEIYDRNADAVVARYNIYVATGLSAATLGSYRNTMITFVDDRYLHCFVLGGFKCYSFIIDTGAALPSSSTTISGMVTTSMPQTAAGTIVALDIDAGPGASYLLYAEEIGADPYPCHFQKTTNANAVTRVDAPTGTRAISYSNYDTKLYYIRGGVPPSSTVGTYTTPTMVTGTNTIWAPGDVPLHRALYTAASNNVITMLADTDGYIWVAYEITTTLGTGKTCTSIKLWRTSIVGGQTLALYGTIDGWRIASAPFEYVAGGVRGRGLHVVKYGTAMNTTAGASHAIVSIDSADKGVISDDPATTAYNSWPLLASLETNLGVQNLTYHRAYGQSARMITVGGAGASCEKYAAMVPVVTTNRGFGFLAVGMRTDRQYDRSCESYGNANYISGGAHFSYGGTLNPAEVGYVDMPYMCAVAAAPAGLAAGIYKYLAVFRYTSEDGTISFSRISEIQSVTTTGANGTVTVAIVPPNVTSKDNGVLVGTATFNFSLTTTELYRTAVGGTQYYLLASTAPTFGTIDGIAQAATRLLSYVDSGTGNATDANLVTHAALYRQPGTPNTPIDRYAPPSGKQLIQHKDRLFTTDPMGSRVYYSSFFVDGEGAWFNPAFSFFVHGGTGPITGLASMDGRLFIFKKNAIFIVDGDGPGEAGPTGNEFSPPTRLSTELGCVDHRSIVVSSEGIVYRSPRGIELLTRSLQVKFLGERVQNTVNDNAYTYGFAMDAGGRLSALVGGGDGYATTELIYDFVADCWSKNVLGVNVRDVCLAELTPELYGSGDIMVYATSAYVMRRTVRSDRQFYDQGATFAGWVIETAWIKTGQQARQRFSELLLLTRFFSSHRIRISVAYDYIEDYTQVETWGEDVIEALYDGGLVEELSLPITSPESLAVRFLIEELEPDDTVTYPINDGQGCDVVGITVEVAPKQGTPKQANRGGVSYPAVYIAGVANSGGGTAGGEEVWVFGRNFTTATAVYFGSTPATGVVVESDGKIVCYAPAHVAGVVSVSVVTPNESASLGSCYTYA